MEIYSGRRRLGLEEPVARLVAAQPSRVVALGQVKLHAGGLPAVRPGHERRGEFLFVELIEDVLV